MIDETNHLWIAKFPSAQDRNDVRAWEMIVHKLAEKCGVVTAQSILKKFNSNYHTFLSKRFDRTKEGEGLKLNISETDNAQDLGLALEVAKYFRLSTVRANKIIKEIVLAVQQWRREADLLGISKAEQDRMVGRFG